MAPGGKGKDPADQPSIRIVCGDVDAFFKKVSGQPGRPDHGRNDLSESLSSEARLAARALVRNNRSDQYPARTVSR